MQAAPRASLFAVLPALLLWLLSTVALAQVRDIVVEPSRILYQGKPLYEKSWAVLIGINRYRHARIPPLSYALNDVKEMREALLRLGFAPDRILALQEGEATKRNIEALLGGRLPRLVGPQDRVLIFFSGHGKDEELPDGKGEGYIIPVDADPDQLYATAISMTSLTDIAKRLRAKHVLYMVDACYSGYAFYPGKSIVNPELVEELTKGKAVQVMTAGRRGETVEERDGLGIFTRAVIAGLKGQADEKNWGWVSVTRLGEYVRDRVFTESRQGQLPQFGNLSGEGQVVFVLPSEGRLPPPPVPPGPGVGVPPRDPIADLLARADGLIARQAFTTPPRDNAYEVLQEILRQSAGHPGASERLRRIGETYKGWARRALEAGQMDRAKRHLEAAKKIFPEDQDIAELEDRLVKLEAEGRRAAEVAKAEAEKRRIEEERRKSEEVARAEAERRRLEEERRKLEEERRLSEERARVEAERRRLEEERQRLAALQREREEREHRERERVAVGPPVTPHERSFPLKVAVALVGPANDASWNAAAIEGLRAAKEKYGADFTFVESVRLADTEGVYRDFAAKGYHLIIGHAFDRGDAALKAAKDFPRAKWAITASSVSAKNVASFDMRQQETPFLAGVLAGLLTKSDRLGAIGGFGFPAIIRQVEGFRIGAMYVNPKVRVFHTYINSWVDVGKAKETALGQMDLGADVVYTALDEAGHGAIKAAQEKGRFAIPSYSPQHTLAPKTVLTSVLLGVPQVVFHMVKEVHEGTFEGKVYRLGLQHGVGGLPPWHKEALENIPKAIRDRVERISEAIRTGKLVIPEITEDGAGRRWNPASLPKVD